MKWQHMSDDVPVFFTTSIHRRGTVKIKNAHVHLIEKEHMG